MPSDRGLSWFGVETTSNFPLERTNQAQPEPKRVAAACANAALNSSKLPNASLMAASKAPSGAFAPSKDN